MWSGIMTPVGSPVSVSVLSFTTVFALAVTATASPTHLHSPKVTH